MRIQCASNQSTSGGGLEPKRLQRVYSIRFNSDAEMKRLQSLGIGAKKKQAEVLTETDEDLLWAKGLLGVDTVVFYNGLYFVLDEAGENTDNCSTHPVKLR